MVTKRTSDGWPAPQSPFHEAELSIQERFGVRSRLDAAARRMIRDYLPRQHIDFYAELPFIVFGTVDVSGQPWASLLAGRPGFLSAPDIRTLRIVGSAYPGDPAADGLQANRPIALLGIELDARRRNRMNGWVRTATSRYLDLAVSQSFGNCPQYIQARTPAFIDPLETGVRPTTVNRSKVITREDRELIEQADTFFIASANLESSAGLSRGVDVSHRGGRSGFIKVDDEVTITTPDFQGNFFFNTLGNLTVEPRAGLLFIDFKSRDLLQLAVRAEVIWDGPEVDSYVGAQRLVRFRVTERYRTSGAVPFRWSEPEEARELRGTGIWSEASTGHNLE